MSTSEILLKLKPYTIGFPCVTKLNDHYTGCTERVFILTTFGHVTFYIGNRIICRNSQIGKFLND